MMLERFKMHRGRLAIIAAAGLVVVASAVALTWALAPASEPPDAHTRSWVEVKRIRSGDRMIVSPEDEVLLAGIRAPYQGEPLFEESSRRLGEVVLGKQVRLRFDQTERDPKERLLAYAFIDDVLVNATLVYGGLAHVRLTTGTRRYDQLLLSAQNDARRNKRGLWSAPAPPPESAYSADPKYGNFHRNSCAEIPKIDPQRIVALKSRETAFDRGFAPCNQCRP